MIPTTIVAVTASPLDLPLTEPFAIATGAAAMAANFVTILILALPLFL